MPYMDLRRAALWHGSGMGREGEGAKERGEKSGRWRTDWDPDKTNVRSNLAKGHIAFLSPLEAAKGFV